MPVMVDWYSTVLNMHVVQRNDFICFLTYDNEHHRLAIVNIEGLHEPDAKAWGLAHVAYTFRDIGELLSTWRRLKDKGIEPYRPIHHGPTISLYYRDPRQFGRAAGRSLQDEEDARTYTTLRESSACLTASLPPMRRLPKPSCCVPTGRRRRSVRPR